MTIQLKLDTKALNTLFPEGSEARLDLTRAVVQNMIKSLAQKSVLTISEEVLSTMTPLFNEMRTASTAKLKELAEFKFSSTELTPKVKTLINKEINQKVDDLVNAEITAKINTIREELHNKISSAFDQKAEILIKSLDKYISDRTIYFLTSKIDSIIKSTVGDK